MPGMPETKQVDSKTWHWCAHCGFLHLPHGTAGHKDPSMLPPQTKNQNNSSTSASTATSKATNSNLGLQFCSNVCSVMNDYLARFFDGSFQF